MIQKLQSLFHSILSNDQQIRTEEEEKQLAIYGILYESARADHNVDPLEEEKINEIMQRYFGLSQTQIEKIKQEAEQLHLDRGSMLNIVKEVKEHLNREERMTLLDELWEVAFADGTIDPHETSLIRRLADLLGLEHQDFIASRSRVAMAIRDND